MTIPLAEIIASEDAAKTLHRFHSGDHDDSAQIFGHNSQATQELLRSPYYQKLIEVSVKEMARWYGGRIPQNGALFQQGNSFRIFDGRDFAREIVDGVDMADIIGSISYYLRCASYNGQLYFVLVNRMSLSSFAAANYLQHQLVSEARTGAYRPTTQVFLWQQPIPQQYRSQ
jgi:hypothetical protein